MKALIQLVSALLATSLVAGMGTGPVSTQDVHKLEARAPSAESAAPEEPANSVENSVKASTSDAEAERRKHLINEAVSALDETQKALKALEDGKPEAALESLATATGKLDLVVARNPKLALAPVDVRLVTYDLYATVEDIERVKKEALEHFQKGRLQHARALIEGLRSDFVVEVVNVPLGTYPAAIKAITPLIDTYKIKEAKDALQRALNTLVVAQDIHPLPIIRTEHMLTRADELAKTASRSKEQNEELTKLLDAARNQLQFAQALGYGQETDFKEFYQQLDEIADKTGGGRSGTGLFDVIRNALRAFGSPSNNN